MLSRSNLKDKTPCLEMTEKSASAKYCAISMGFQVTWPISIARTTQDQEDGKGRNERQQQPDEEAPIPRLVSSEQLRGYQ